MIAELETTAGAACAGAHRRALRCQRPTQQSLQEKLVVQDNGIGLPEGFDYRKSKFLGLQLISILSRQLQIGIELRNEAGTEFAITFPVRPGRMGDRL